MSFWDLSDGESAKDTGAEYEIPGGNLDPIPDNSNVLAIIDEAKWEKTSDGDEFLKLRWSVLDPKPYANRKIFHKLWVTDFDPNAKDKDKARAKRDKALKMLASIDTNAGGKLMEKSGQPSDDDLAMALCGKPMVIKCMIWEMPDRERYGEFIRGNWVSAVMPKDRELSIGEEKQKPKAQSGGSGGGYGGSSSRDLDDDIPF